MRNEPPMPFTEEIAETAYRVMGHLDQTLSGKYVTVVQFLIDNPDAAPPVRGNPKIIIGSEEYIRRQAEAFMESRKPRAPSPPLTIPDDMVSFIINKYFDVPEEELEKAVELHHLSMGAENLIGDILERYVASVVESQGLIWCSGSIVKAVDFVYRHGERKWLALQVKNRDNSENSSSSAIRKGTDIKKWFRTFSKKKGDNWNNSPNIVNATLSENGFRDFVERYLLALKS